MTAPLRTVGPSRTEFIFLRLYSTRWKTNPPSTLSVGRISLSPVLDPFRTLRTDGRRRELQHLQRYYPLSSLTSS